MPIEPTVPTNFVWTTLAQSGGVVTPALPSQQPTVGPPPAGGTTATPPATPLPGNTPGGAPPASGGFPFVLALPLLLLAFIIFSSWSSQKKEKRKRADLMSSLKKQDRVQTIGGIIGTVVEMRDDEVVLKVDENSNTRIRFSRSAIQQILKSSGAGNGGGGGGGGNGAESAVEAKSTGGAGVKV